jgi:pimeloyl-ACP methyl ester carboxylesterase
MARLGRLAIDTPRQSRILALLSVICGRLPHVEDNGTKTDRRRDCVVLLHGTWGSRSDWMKPGSPLRAAIKEALNDSVDCREFQWSGRNRQGDRRAASIALTRWLRAPGMKRYRKVHIVAHSHGGNIAARASFLAPTKMASLVTVGTPFMAFGRRNKLEDVLPIITIPLACIAAYAVADPIITAAIHSIGLLFSLMAMLGGDPESWLGLVLAGLVFLTLLVLPFLVGKVAARLISNLLDRAKGRRVFRSYRGFGIVAVPTRCLFDARDEARFAIWSTLTASSAIRRLSSIVLGLGCGLYFVLFIALWISWTLWPLTSMGQGRASSYLGPLEPVYFSIMALSLAALLCSAMMSPLFSAVSLGARSALDLLFIRIRILFLPYGEAVQGCPVRLRPTRLGLVSARLRHSRLCHDQQVITIIVEWLDGQVNGDRSVTRSSAASDLAD